MRQYKVLHFPFGSTAGEELDNVVSARVTRVKDAESNSLELTLDNYNGRALSNGVFNVGVDDIVKVYAADGIVDTTNASHLLGVFFVKTHEILTKEQKVKINCGDNTYKMLNRIYGAIYDTATSAKDIIFNIVQNSDSDGTTQNGVTTVMDSTKSDGNAFDTFTYAVANKTAYEVVAELSESEFTGDDKTYLFWFDETGVFYWTYPGDTVDSYVIDYTDADVLDMKPDKNEADTISSIEYDAGKDLDGVTVLGLYHDPTSTSTNIKFKTMLDINKYVRFGIKSIYGLSDVEDATLLTVINNDDFVRLIKNEARSRAAKYISIYSHGRWEVKVIHKGRTFDMAALHTVQNSRRNVALPNLRIKRIVHKLNKGGWETNIQLEEDEDAIAN